MHLWPFYRAQRMCSGTCNACMWMVDAKVKPQVSFLLLATIFWVCPIFRTHQKAPRIHLPPPPQFWNWRFASPHQALCIWVLPAFSFLIQRFKKLKKKSLLITRHKWVNYSLLWYNLTKWPWLTFSSPSWGHKRTGAFSHWGWTCFWQLVQWTVMHAESCFHTHLKFHLPFC